MKRKAATVAVDANVDHSSDEELEFAGSDQAVDVDESTEGEAVFHFAGGSIFADTSPIEDAFLRQAISGRYRF